VRIDSSTSSIPEYCKDCQQGKENQELKNLTIPKLPDNPEPKFTIAEIINREDKEMPVKERGACDNCKRPNMAIQFRGAHGKLCGSCCAAITGIGGGDAELALAERREKLMGKGHLRKPGTKSERKRSLGKQEGKKMSETTEMLTKIELCRCGKLKGHRGRCTGSGGRTPVLNPKKEKAPEVGPEKGDGVIGKLIEGYNACLDKASAIMTVLLTLKEFGAAVELPTRHVVE
jgi:hypothetical protein